jgi:hypothetical protein
MAICWAEAAVVAIVSVREMRNGDSNGGLSQVDRQAMGIDSKSPSSVLPFHAVARLLRPAH